MALDTQYNDTHHKDTQDNYIQHKVFKRMTFSIIIFSRMPFNKIKLNSIMKKCHTQYNDTQSLESLCWESFVLGAVCAECRYAECSGDFFDAVKK